MHATPRKHSEQSPGDFLKERREGIGTNIVYLPFSPFVKLLATFSAWVRFNHVGVNMPQTRP